MDADTKLILIGERDFTAGVIVRLVERMLNAEAEVEHQKKKDTTESAFWAELGELLSGQPEYEEERRGGAYVLLLPVAIRVLKRLGLK